MSQPPSHCNSAILLNKIGKDIQNFPFGYETKLKYCSRLGKSLLQANNLGYYSHSLPPQFQFLFFLSD